MRSRTSSGPQHSIRNGSAPQVHLPPHITGEEEPEELDLHFDDVSSTREIVERTEEPGIDSLRGTFGAIGTIIRAKRRARALSAASRSHRSQSDLSQTSLERTRSPASQNSLKPGWLMGNWATPKSSRFQPMEDPDDRHRDVEKGQIEMHEKKVENLNDDPTPMNGAGRQQLTRTESPLPMSHSQPSTTKPGTPASVQLRTPASRTLSNATDPQSKSHSRSHSQVSISKGKDEEHE